VARWWLTHFGWPGLVSFKAAVVLVVAALTVLIARSRPRAAGGVLGLGCVALAGVVLYSAALCIETARPGSWERHLEVINGQTRQAYRRLETYHIARTAVCADLVAGRRTLREAAEWVARAEKWHDPRWLRAEAASDPGRPAGELFAAYVIRHAVVAQGNPQAAWQVAVRLEQEFARTYGSVPPRGHRVFLVGTEPKVRDGGPWRLQVMSGARPSPPLSRAACRAAGSRS
jgi:hypothetical protein